MNDLPLLDLFTRLREAGLPLGMEEYQLVLRAIESGFGLQDRAALARLCRTLWVKSADEGRIFDYHFEQVMVSKAISFPAALVTPPKTIITPTSSEAVPSPSENLQETKVSQRKVSQITRYVAIGGAFILGIGIVWMTGLYFRKQNPSQTVGQTPTPSPTAGSSNNEINTLGLKAHQTSIAKPNVNQTQVDWLAVVRFVALPLGIVLGTGAALTTIYLFIRFGIYLFIRSGSKQIAENRLDERSSLPDLTANTLGSRLTSELTKIDDELQIAEAVRQATKRDDENLNERFILTNDYFPVTQRQMKRSWRHLRYLIREGRATELDIETTVSQIGRQGIFLEPVLVPCRVNRIELLLLIDQDGSMVPFHNLSQRLAETALRGGHLGRTHIYYFHNCPLGYLYHDPSHQEAEAVSDLLPRMRSERSVVLIFSDAGAARGGFSRERLELTTTFLDQLKQQIRYIAWLNPMPQSRWQTTTADEIAHLVPMFELTRQGLDAAIDVLRGHRTRYAR